MDSVSVYFEVEDKDFTADLMRRVGGAIEAVAPERFSEEHAKYSRHSVCYVIRKKDTYEFLITSMAKEVYPILPEGKAYLILSAWDKLFNTYGVSREEEPEKEKEIEAVLVDFLDYAKAIYYVVKPKYAAGFYELVIDECNYDFSGIFWITFFSPERVKKIGREKFFSAPAYRVEELEDGGILLVADKKSGMVGPELRREIACHLGLGDEK